MKKIYLAVVILLLSTTCIFSQATSLENPVTKCATMEMHQKHLTNNPSARLAFCPLLAECYADPADDGTVEDCAFDTPNCTFRLPIIFHILENSAGNGHPANLASLIDQEMGVLNGLYSPIGVSFFECGERNIITDPNGGDGTWTDTQDDDIFGGNITSANDVAGVINIYLVVNFNIAICGYAYLPTDDANLGLNHMVYSTNTGSCGFGTASTSGHEIGHYLGLFHTHNDDSAADEVVNADGSSVSPTQNAADNYCTDFNRGGLFGGAGIGDGIYDTNPDPLLSEGRCFDAGDPACNMPCIGPVCPECYVDVCNGCSYTGPAPFQPDLTNIMNYNPWASCGGTDFTTCQLAKMSDLLNTCKGQTICCMPDPEAPTIAPVCSNNPAGLLNAVTTTTEETRSGEGSPFAAECFAWWDVSTGGTPLSEGVSFSPPIPTDAEGCLTAGEYMFYVSNANFYTDATCESNRVEFTVTITPCGACSVPVELLAFSGKYKDGVNQLSWSTASEKDNAYFEIERSNTGTKFESIGKVQGAGTTVETQYYTFSDLNPSTTLNYYRLKQVDIDGTFEYSSIVSINIEDKDFNTKVFPSPTSNVLNVEANQKVNTVEIIDLTGRVIMSELYKNLNSVQLNVAHLPTGTYFVSIKSDEAVNLLRFVKN